MPIPVIAIFDVGKTNKKIFLFDEDYRIVYERSARFLETEDEDGFPCENLESLRQSVFDSLKEVSRLKQFEVKAVNFSAYGASFVYLDEDGKALTPLYNYLKPYPEDLSREFYAEYGGEEQFASETASPALGSLNSGLQLYRLKKEQPEIFRKLKCALHLPQYLSFLVSGRYCTDITSIGCHTAMWDMAHNQYHQWITQEGIIDKLPPITPAEQVFEADSHKVGIGLHDSSAALIPYLINFKEPFVLISTGTWCISLNPFEHSVLTTDELKRDCLCYLQYNGKPVKASRLFSGNEHEQQVKRIAEHFNVDMIRFRSMAYDSELIAQLKSRFQQDINKNDLIKDSGFAERNLSAYKNDIEAYHQLMLDLVNQQLYSTKPVLKGPDIKRIFVDGGFSKNAIYMHLLASVFPDTEVYAASMAQATALGAALAIHNSWNTKPIPHDLIGLKYYSAG